jgi:hypothetical protein
MKNDNDSLKVIDDKICLHSALGFLLTFIIADVAFWACFCNLTLTVIFENVFFFFLTYETLYMTHNILQKGTDRKLLEMMILPLISLVGLILCELYGTSTRLFGTHIWSLNILVALYWNQKVLNGDKFLIVAEFRKRVGNWVGIMYVVTAIRIISQIWYSLSIYKIEDPLMFDDYFKYVMDVIYFLGFTVCWPYIHASLI